jgi:hypothetical protein
MRLLPALPGLSARQVEFINEYQYVAGIDFKETPAHFRTRPNLLVQLLSNQGLVLINSGSDAQEPAIGPWVMSIRKPNGDLVYRGTENRIFTAEEVLALLPNHQDPPASLTLTFHHPRIDGYESAPVQLTRIHPSSFSLVKEPKAKAKA